MARQSFTWGAEPDNTDQIDVTTELTLGVEFTVDGDRDCLGVKFRAPLTLPVLPSPAFVSIWDTGPTILAFQSFTWSEQDAGEDVEIDFDEPLALTDGTVYRAALQSYERFVNTAGWAWPFVDSGGVLTATANNGVLAVTYGYPNLVSGAGSNYFVSPIVEVDDPVEPDGAGQPLTSATRGWPIAGSTEFWPITSSTRRGP